MFEDVNINSNVIMNFLNGYENIPSKSAIISQILVCSFYVLYHEVDIHH